MQDTEFVEQLQRQRGTGQIHAKIALQPDGDCCTPQMGARKAPAMRLPAHGREHAFIDQFDNGFNLHGAGLANVADTQVGLLFENDCAGLQHLVAMVAVRFHAQAPSLARG